MKKEKKINLFWIGVAFLLIIFAVWLIMERSYNQHAGCVSQCMGENRQCFNNAEKYTDPISNDIFLGEYDVLNCYNKMENCRWNCRK